jgi:hypothetical protein
MNEIDFIPRKAAMAKLEIKSWAGMKAFEKKFKIAPIPTINRHFGYKLSDIRRALGEKVEPASGFVLGPNFVCEKRR